MSETTNLPSDLQGMVHAGLPPVREEKSPLEQKFDTVYSTLNAATQERNGDAYIQGLSQLTELIKTEVRENNAPPHHGDLSHSFMEWYHHVSSPYGDRADKIKDGQDVSSLTNTIDNNSKPHRDFPGDSTMQHNSHSVADSVSRFISGRGKHFIVSSVVSGTTNEQSHFLVQTTFKGLPQKPITSKTL